MHDVQVVFQFDLIAFSPNCFWFVREIREHVGLGPGCHSRRGSRRTRTNCLKVLNRHFQECESALIWQSAKTPGGGRPPRQEECLCLTIHIAAALHLLFSACTLDVTSTVMTRMHVRSSMRAHCPLSGSSVNESCAQDTEQEHGKHGSGTLLSSFLLVGTSVRLVGLRIWSVREARRNECETRCWLSLERVRNSLLVVTAKSQIVLGCWS